MSFLDKIKQRTEQVRETLLQQMATPELKQERIDICNSCEHLIKVTSQCSKCGCFVHAKASLFVTKCPLNKWPLVNVNTQEKDVGTGKE